MENYHKVCTDKKDFFVSIWKKTMRCSEEDAHVAWESESANFTREVDASEYLRASTEISLISSFIDIAVNGLSISRGSKSEAFLESRAAKSGGQWINVCRLVITAYGELNLRIRSGQILRASNPVVVYEGDAFQPRTNENGDLIVAYQPQIPRRSAKIIGCWVKLFLPHGGTDYKWLLEEDISRLHQKSKTKNNEDGNSLYSSNGGQIDSGFLETKTLKHSMRSYTKLRVSETTAFDGDDEYEEQKQSESFTPEAQHQENTKTITIEDDHF